MKIQTDNYTVVVVVDTITRSYHFKTVSSNELLIMKEKKSHRDDNSYIVTY